MASNGSFTEPSETIMRPIRWLTGALILASAPVLAETVMPERGRALDHLIRHDCGSCHGMTLKGGLGPALTPEALAGKPRALLVNSIIHGRAGTAMPPWRDLLGEAEVEWIVERLLEGMEE